MCFTTDNAIVKVAEKPIIVYKCVNYNRGRVLSQVEDYPYTHMAINNYIKLAPSFTFSDGYTSMFDLGYHSDVVPHRHSNAIFYIPVGAEYIEGWYNDEMSRKNYISSNIVYAGRKNLITRLLLKLHFYKEKKNK